MADGHELNDISNQRAEERTTGERKQQGDGKKSSGWCNGQVLFGEAL